MAMMFHKLNHNHNISDVGLVDLREQYGMVIDGVWRGLKYWSVSEEFVNKVSEYIPPNKDFIVRLMVINNHYIPPHIDDGPVAALNFYIDTDAQNTIFYENTDVEKQTIDAHATERGGFWNEKDLTPISSFCAEPSDIYLLDISKIHSVMADKVSKDRTVLTIQSGYTSFEEWADWLRKKGKL